MFALLVGILLGSFVPVRRWTRSDRRLGLLSASGTPTPEAARTERLRQLGEAGTYRVHNCGEILHVDYERGELIVAADGRHR